MVAIERLDEDDLRDLSQRTDTLGCCRSTCTPIVGTTRTPQAAAIDLRNRFRELQRRIGKYAGSDQSRDVAAALELLWPHIDLAARCVGNDDEVITCDAVHPSGKLSQGLGYIAKGPPPARNAPADQAQLSVKQRYSRRLLIADVVSVPVP